MKNSTVIERPRAMQIAFFFDVETGVEMFENERFGPWDYDIRGRVDVLSCDDIHSMNNCGGGWESCCGFDRE